MVQQQKPFIASVSSVPTASGEKGTVNPGAINHAQVSRCAGPAPFIVQCCFNFDQGQGLLAAVAHPPPLVPES